MHPLPTNRTDYVQGSSCQALGLPWAPGGKSPLVHINHVNYILLANHCFRKKTHDGILANEIDVKCGWVGASGNVFLSLKKRHEKMDVLSRPLDIFCQDTMPGAAAAILPP